MNKYFKMMLPALAVAAIVVFASAKQDDEVITKREGITIVNTTSLSKNVKGFKGLKKPRLCLLLGKENLLRKQPNKM